MMKNTTTERLHLVLYGVLSTLAVVAIYHTTWGQRSTATTRLVKVGVKGQQYCKICKVRVNYRTHTLLEASPNSFDVVNGIL